jgi:flagellin-like hook-associated protein FlgL
VGDVVDALNAAIQTVDPGAVVSIDPATNNRLQITPAAGPITISDLAQDSTAADLGVSQTFAVGGDEGLDLDPKLTEHSKISELGGLSGALGKIRLTNMGESRDLDLSGAETIQDIMNLVEGLDMGIRVEIAESGDRINFINELSGGDMSIGEIVTLAGGDTATRLGVRSFTRDTSLDDFNHGLGVGVRTGSTDPETGLPDPSKDLDFRITARDGSTFDVDLAGAETVGDVLDAINAATGGTIAAQLARNGNGIQLVDLSGGGGDIAVEALNGSYAAGDLGLLDGAPDGTGATFTGEDRAMIAVESVFTHLIDLRDALMANDERGITLAGEKLEADISRVTETRAEVGVRVRRVTDATSREEMLQIQDQELKSQVQDLDYTEATVRFNLLQMQLQAGMQVTASVSQISLLDYIS